MNKIGTFTGMFPAKPGTGWCYLAPGRGLRQGAARTEVTTRNVTLWSSTLCVQWWKQATRAYF